MHIQYVHECVHEYLKYRSIFDDLMLAMQTGTSLSNTAMNTELFWLNIG